MKQNALIAILLTLTTLGTSAEEFNQQPKDRDLSEVLMQGRQVPYRDPNTGEINGYRVLDAQEGSLFEQVGLQQMDIIKGVNGEPVDSVEKAMELYSNLKMNQNTKVQVERHGEL